MELKLYLRMLQRNWWIVALTALSAVNIALAASYSATPMYRASAKFVVSPNTALATERDIVNSLSTLDRRSIVSTYAEIISSSRIFQETGQELKIASSDLRDYSHSAVVLADANVLQLTVEGPDAETVARLANAIGERSIIYAEQFLPVYNLDSLDVAVAPSMPFSPQPLRDAGIAITLGVTLGSVLAIVYEQLRIPFEALRRRASIDSASSAYNRRHFQSLIEEELSGNETSTVSLGLIQLDGLRDLLETLPPIVVQRLLHQVTQILRQELRGSDIIGRWDDIHFAVLLPATPGLAASRTVERIKQALQQPLEVEQIDFDLNPYIGIGTCRGNQPAAMLILQAETTLEKARQGSNGTTGAIFVNDLETKPAQSIEKRA
ncbi:MAG: diguanylate cyclase [Chloroflexota bacterium]